jgi:hypothetical protein
MKLEKFGQPLDAEISKEFGSSLEPPEINTARLTP